MPTRIITRIMIAPLEPVAGWPPPSLAEKYPTSSIKALPSKNNVAKRNKKGVTGYPQVR